MKDVVNQALVADGYEFTDQNTRGRYLGTVVAKRPQFLKDYHGKWRKVSDVLEKAGQHAPYAKTVVKADPVTSSLRSKASDPENDVGKAAAELSADTASLPDLPTLELVSPNRSTKTQPPGLAAAPTSEVMGPTPETTPHEAISRKRGPSGDRQRKKQKSSAGFSKSAQSFHLSACLLFSRAFGNLLSFRGQLRKQVFIGKRSSIG